MEIDGDGGGGGETEERGSGELVPLLEAIKTSEVLENRTALINQLEGSSQFSADDLGLILECLVISWDDSTCSGVSHCMLHKSVLQVALKCTESDTTACLGQFLTLGAKASSWCRKHLTWFVESLDDSESVQEEEHNSLCLEMISLTLNVSIKLLPMVAKCITVDVVHATGDFISELLTLMESSIVDKSCLNNHGAIDLPTSSSGVIGLPVHALASALQRCEIKNYNAIDGKSISTMFKFSTSLINLYKTAPDSSKDHLAQHISSILDIISKVRHLCAFYQMEKLTLELHTLFMCSSGNSKAALSQCKPSLASFMSMLGHLNFTEVDANAICSAMLDLYHLLVREQHWALIHLAMDSFGYFAARTSFTQLWRFIPGDAALSYNTNTGVDIDENGFMSELRAFLQKEAALHADKWSEEQIRFLVSEGRALKKLVGTTCELPLASESEKTAAISKDANTKKRKIPDGIGEGMALLQNGLKVMRNALDETGSTELKDRFATHLSRLESAVSQIASFSDKI